MKVYWTYKKFDTDNFKAHEHYQKHCVLAIALTKSGVFYNFTTDGIHHHKAFNDKAESIEFIKQINKPEYVKVCGLSYELEFLDSDSSAWYELYYRYENFIDNLRKIKDNIDKPL